MSANDPEWASYRLLDRQSDGKRRGICKSTNGPALSPHSLTGRRTAKRLLITLRARRCSGAIKIVDVTGKQVQLYPLKTS